MSARLTQDQRRHLSEQLVAALLPSQEDEHARLAQSVARLLFTERYGAKGVRQIRNLDPDWLTKFDRISLKPSNEEYARRVHLAEPIAAPGRFWEGDISPVAQAAIDTWWDTKQRDTAARRAMKYEVDRLLATCKTLEQALERVPEARSILKLPEARAVDAIATTLRERLAARQEAKQ